MTNDPTCGLSTAVAANGERMDVKPFRLRNSADQSVTPATRSLRPPVDAIPSDRPHVQAPGAHRFRP